MRRAVALAMLTACRATEAGPIQRAPAADVTSVARDALCVTRGAVGPNVEISDPTVRAFAPSTSGDAVALGFRYLGPTARVRELASGAARHQVGLKLRAQDSCNVIYVMWRSDTAGLVVSVKSNPGLRTHKQCGASGYVRVKPSRSSPIASLAPGGAHAMRAEIVDDDLTAWVDDRVVWQGRLPAFARSLAGPVGLRTDNVALDQVTVSATPTDQHREPCAQHERTED